MMSLAMLALLPQLIAAGLATAAQVKALLATSNPGMTDVEMDAILDLVIAGATRHKALADADMKPPTV
jgi:hypothetical protein